MQLGLVSAILDQSDFYEMIDIVAENGLDCVEVACWPAGKAERRYAGVSHIGHSSSVKSIGQFSIAILTFCFSAYAKIGFQTSSTSFKFSEIVFEGIRPIKVVTKLISINFAASMTV